MRHAGVCPHVGFLGNKSGGGGQSLFAKRPTAYTVIPYVSVHPRQGKTRRRGDVIKLSP